VPYATLAELKRRVGQEKDQNDQDDLLRDVLVDSSALFDEWTNTWWNKRSVTITTDAHSSPQIKLFMPAPIISVTSITEDDKLIDAADYHVYADYIEKDGRYSWSTTQQGIVVVAVLGFTTIPKDARAVTLEIASMLSGMRTKSFTMDDGVERTVFLSDMPDWVKTKVERSRLRKYSGQVELVAKT
jgi:hypothetical protein